MRLHRLVCIWLRDEAYSYVSDTIHVQKEAEGEIMRKSVQSGGALTCDMGYAPATAQMLDDA